MARKTKAQRYEKKEDSVEKTAVAKKMTKEKVVPLKQWAVTALDEKLQKFHTFLLATCALKAREYFTNRFEKAVVLSIMQSAVSDKDSSWLETHSPFYD